MVGKPPDGCRGSLGVCGIPWLLLAVSQAKSEGAALPMILQRPGVLKHAPWPRWPPGCGPRSQPFTAPEGRTPGMSRVWA